MNRFPDYDGPQFPGVGLSDFHPRAERPVIIRPCCDGANRQQIGRLVSFSEFASRREMNSLLALTPWRLPKGFRSCSSEIRSPVFLQPNSICFSETRLGTKLGSLGMGWLAVERLRADEAILLHAVIVSSPADDCPLHLRAKTIKFGRKGIGCELSARYYLDGAAYCQAAEREAGMPTLFDLVEAEEEALAANAREENESGVEA